MTDHADLLKRAKHWETGTCMPGSCVHVTRELSAALREVLAERDTASRDLATVRESARRLYEELAVERAKVAPLESERTTVAEALAEVATLEQQLEAERGKVERVRQSAMRGWESARVLAISPPTYPAPATERAADAALTELAKLGPKETP